ncbi:MAG: hypothetical protein JWL90_789 [Chthoniobacteraceae bacterium]|nr:hypothetical protein [Chthoniobacteraceae bacterium]
MPFGLLLDAIVSSLLKIPFFLVVLLFCKEANARPFALHNDTFAFSNDTVFAYGIDERGNLEIKKRDKPVEFGHRCFVLTRAVMQFYQFARFAPEQPRLSREEYKKIVLRVCRVPIWSSGPAQRIVIPGYRDLHHFSIAYEGLLKENLGGWLPTYLRVGNWRMLMGHPRAGQAAAARWLVKSMDEHRLRALYLARFPHMNHVVIAYDMQRRPNGDLHFTVYDPNYPGEPTFLDYRHDLRSFEFAKRWYFPGGRVNVMRVYISPFH